MSGKNGTDRESLMAMEALLRIRSDSVTTETEGKILSPRSVTQGKIPTTSAPNAVHVQAARHAVQRSAQGTPAARQVSFSPHLSWQKTTFFPQSPAFLPLEPTALSKSKQTTPVSPAVLSVGYPAQSVTPQHRKLLKTSDDIRTGEIVAALHSKPQRGRKRDNLSAMERLELTRTRNREHAKSTRIRKKARYQELLDNEKKYEKLKGSEDLNTRRHHGVLKLLSNMNAKFTGRTGTTPSGATQGLRVEDRTVTFSEEPSHYCCSLRDVVASTKDFAFRVQGHATLSSNLEDQTNGVEAIDRFCQEVHSRTVESYGSTGRLACKTQETGGGLALNKGDVGFTAVEVLLRDERRRSDFVLVGAILQYRFLPLSHKLESVQWYTLSENFDRLKDLDDVSASSNESLGQQISYPSVVSLDPLVTGEGLSDKSSPDREEYAPGLNL